MEPISGSSGAFRAQSIPTRPVIQGPVTVSRPMRLPPTSGDLSKKDTLQLSSRYREFAAENRTSAKPILNPLKELEIPDDDDPWVRKVLTGAQKRGLKVYAELIRLVLHPDGQ